MDLKCIILAVLFVSIVGIPHAAAVTQYDIEAFRDSVLVNMTFELYTDSPTAKVNYWTTALEIPSSFSIISIGDSIGDIKNYDLSNSLLTFETNRGKAKDREVVTIEFTASGVIEKTYSPLKMFNLSLPGFSDIRPDVPDEVTNVRIMLDEKVMSVSHSFGFLSEISGNGVNLSGRGPTNIRVLYSNSGREYEHYVLFGEGNISEADELFGIVPAVTGLAPPFERFPVVVLEDRDYERRLNDWSAGEYSGGMIFIKKSSLGKPELAPLVIHETTHGFNENVLRWSDRGVIWFDEGVAEYAEFVAGKVLGVRQPEIFGEAVTYRKGNIIYTLPSRGTSGELWDYYINDRDFMETWTPKQQQTRVFGYAFSELVIRDYVLYNGPEALHKVIGRLLDITEPSVSPEESTGIILGIMGSDMRPCFSSQKSSFESCLERVNAMEPEIPESITVRNRPNINIDDIEPVAGDGEPADFLSAILAVIGGFFNWLFSSITSVFGR